MVSPAQLVETTTSTAYSSHKVVACYMGKIGKSGSYTARYKHISAQTRPENNELTSITTVGLSVPPIAAKP
jgi:hypothetical protein